MIAILEPVFAGTLVSLINKYLINGSAGTWFANWCVPPDDNIDEDEVLDEEEHSMSSTTTTIIDCQTDVHTHCH